MDESLGNVPFRLADWIVYPDECLVGRENAEGSHKLTPRAMSVLVYLSRHPEQLVTTDQLLEEFWPSVYIAPNAVQKIVSEIRHALEDDPRDPRILRTIHKRGYKLLLTPAAFEAGVPPADRSGSESHVFSTAWNRKSIGALAAAFLLTVATVFGPKLLSGADTNVTVAMTQNDDQAVALIIVEETIGAADPALKLLSQQALFTFAAAADDVDQNRMSLKETESIEADLTLTISRTDSELLISVLPSETFRPHIDRYELADGSVPLDEMVIEHLKEDIQFLLDDDRRKLLQTWGTSNPHALSSYEQGARHASRYDAASFKLAIEQFMSAVELDRYFVEAYLGLAALYANLGYFASSTEEREAAVQNLLHVRNLAMNAAIASEAIDAIDSYAAWISAVHPMQLEREWREELKADPENSFILRRYSTLLTGAGLTDEARAFIERAIQFAASEEEQSAIAAEYVTLAGVSSKEHEVLLAEEYVKRRPNHVISLYGLVANHSHLGNFVKADRYLQRLRQIDKEGVWAHAAWMEYAAQRGKLPIGSEALTEAIADPKTTNLARGLILFVLGDIEGGIAAWRNIESGLVPILWEFRSGTEPRFASNVTIDERYQSLLDDLGVGRRWRNYLLKQVADLSEYTSIEAVAEVEVLEFGPIQRFAGLEKAKVDVENSGG